MASGDDEDEKEEESINGLGAKGAIKDTECSFRRWLKLPKGNAV